jgi:hypothetical protein
MALGMAKGGAAAQGDTAKANPRMSSLPREWSKSMTGLKGESTIGFVISYVVEICRGLNTLIF